MEPQQQSPTPNPPPPDLPPPQSQPPSSAPSPVPTSTVSHSSTPIPNSNQNPNPNPNPNSNKPLTPAQQSPQSQPSYPPNQSQPPPNPQSRLARPQWPQHQPSHLSHFTPASSSSVTSSVPAPLPSPASSNTPTGTPQNVGSQRGGMAIGVPAASQSAPYSPSFGQHQFGGLGRGTVSSGDSSAGPSTPQVRPQVPGYQNTATQMRPGGISVHHQPRPAPIRSITNPNNQPTNAQNLSGHGLLRGSSVGSPGLNSPSASQSPQLRGQPQPWLMQSQGKPPLPSHTYRGHMDPQHMQQRSHVPQQQSSPGPTQNLQASSSLQQPQSFSSHQQDQFRQAQSVRPGSSLSPQPQTPRGIGHQRPSSFGNAQPFQPGAHNINAAIDANESSNSLLSKRTIHELVTQVDPSEKLDPEVADILVDIAEDFVDSITTFGCSLAKHRKSNILEAKDILLHLERNWNLTIPGFGGDEIRSYRKPVINDIHRERLAAVKKSIGAETGTVRNLPGQQATKGLPRGTGGAMDSQP